MKKQNENSVRPAKQPAGPRAKKTYQAPELTVHGSLEAITKAEPTGSLMSLHHLHRN